MRLSRVPRRALRNIDNALRKAARRADIETAEALLKELKLLGELADLAAEAGGSLPVAFGSVPGERGKGMRWGLRRSLGKIDKALRRAAKSGDDEAHLDLRRELNFLVLLAGHSQGEAVARQRGPRPLIG